MAYEVKGVLVQKLEVKSGVSAAGKAWQSQDFVIQVQEGQYSNHVVINAYGEAKVQMLEGLQVGREVTCFVNLSAKEYQGKWYGSVGLWKIEAPVNSTTYHTPPVASVPQSVVVPSTESDGDLPF